MPDEWRIILYPLGFLSSLAFGARFIIQWIQSERKGTTVVPRSFWQLSLLGNILLSCHGIIQGQFPVCIAQACNSIISWRNLDLMQTKRAPVHFKKVILLLIACSACVVAIFGLQSVFLPDPGDIWFRIPTAPWQNKEATSLPMEWSLLGFIGYILFSARFWVQWWFAEHTLKTSLPLSFWWLSLIGAAASCMYFLRIFDLVNLIGPAVGLVPYLRNVLLIHKSKVPQNI